MSNTKVLTTEELALIERNRQRALLKKQKNLRQLTTDEVFQLEKYSELQVGSSQDTGGGFFTAPKDDINDVVSNRILNGNKPGSQSAQEAPKILPDTRENVCDECDDNFSNSFLFSNYGEKICDICKDVKGRHSLITRTEAKNEYLLADVDLDQREPPLKFILKKNPHEYFRGYMKLYLKFQVEERALEVWESEEKLEEERQLRGEKRENRKRKQFDKQMKELRMNTRSSYYAKRLASREHQHEFGDEEPVVDEDDPDGEYFRQVCTSCGFEKKYEKM